MRTIDDHRREISALLAPVSEALGIETLPVDAAMMAASPELYRRRVLADDLRAPSSLPAFDNSQMDGYAVLAADLASATADSPVTLRVVQRIAAGDAAGEHLGGTATPIMTGAPVPRGADAVVQIERADPPVFPSQVRGQARSGQNHAGQARETVPGEAAPAEAAGPPEPPAAAPVVAFASPVDPGTFIRAAGSDVATGEVLLPASTELGPAQFGVIAGTGAIEITVRARPRVLLVSTGHEIRDPGSLLAPGQIFDANSAALTAALLEIGCAVTPVPCRSDDAEVLLELLDEHAPHHDVVVTVGGVSAGVREVVRDALGPRGVSFVKVAMQPGGPQGFGMLRLGDADTPGPAIPTVCLPGNPVSALVSFEAFLRPALRGTLGVSPVLRENRRAPAAHPFTSPAGHHQLRRGVLNDDGALELVGGPSSHLLHSYAASTVLVHVPVGTAEVSAGDELDYWRIDG
ncbi:gephyrin-like molybdotransferase Glp [Herbiconiux sp. A18JL235]|uniref:Molybdopterin molybdenumtransferase n=1 Tax=Herbiconiux sp. A18JL235 TaxID=3152363 RepID=A0AB39BLD2_9MICO